MIHIIINKFALLNQFLSKILEPYFDLAIYLFNGCFIALFFQLYFLVASQEMVVDQALLQEFFKDICFFLSASTFLCLFSAFHVFSKQFIRGFLLIIIGFLSICL